MTPRFTTALRLGAVIAIAGLLSACHAYGPSPYYASKGYSGYSGHGHGYNQGHGYGRGHGYRPRYRHRRHGD